MKKPASHRVKETKSKQGALARALVRKLDFIFQRYYHQSIQEITTEFELHNAFESVPPTPEQLITVIRSSRILHMRSATPVVEMRDALDRFVSGTLGSCRTCGRRIPSQLLEENPLIATCTECQLELSSRIYSPIDSRRLMPGHHDP